MRHFFLLGYYFTSVLLLSCPAVKRDIYTPKAKKMRILKNRRLNPYVWIPVTQDVSIEYSRKLKITDFDLNAITALNTTDKINSENEEVTALGILRKAEKAKLSH